MSAADNKIRFGVAYYHEYHQSPRLDTDLDLMVAAGIDTIRVGESVWSKWEPTEGVFNLDWLQPILDGAHARGIRVIIGTPTYSAPPWLRQRYPHLAIVNRDGSTVAYGGRQDANYSDPEFQRLAGAVVTAIVNRYKDHPAVVGWQVDNEPGVRLIYNENTLAGFRNWLANRYQTPANLNQLWGLTYWSHEITEWDQIWPPEGNTTPSYELAWRRYSAQVTHDYMQWQTNLVRSLIGAEQFVTTCISMGQSGLDITTINELFDLPTANIYYMSGDGLELPGNDELKDGLKADFVPWAGPAFLNLQCDTARGMKQEPFMITETDATNIGGSADNWIHYPGQMRQTIFAMIARGARMIEYWHWHSLPYGAETYWGGVIGHSLQPGRIYRELSVTTSELAPVNAELAKMLIQSDVAILVDPNSRWSMEFMSPFAAPGSGWFGDPAGYDRMVAAIYRGVFDAKLTSDIIAPHQLPSAAQMLEKWRAIYVPAYYIASEEVVQKLNEYAELGGQLILTARTGYADEESVVRAEIGPAGFAAAGIWYQEFMSIRHPIPVAGKLSGKASAWADELHTADAATQVLATYQHPHLGNFPAVTYRPVGLGAITYVGTLPDRELSLQIVEFIKERAGLKESWRENLPATVTAYIGLIDQKLVAFVFNWSWQPTEISITGAVDFISKSEISNPLKLSAWDARIIALP
jgi:beta-galactosidase